MVRWTRIENMALFLIIEKYTNAGKSNRELAEIAFETFPDILSQRSINAISQHVAALKMLYNDLNIPDPVHNSNRSFNKY